MGLKDAMRKAAGLLVEMPPEEQLSGSSANLDDLLAQSEAQAARLGEQSDAPPARPETQAKTIEQIVREADGPNLDEIAVQSPPPVTAEAGKPLDFAAIYRAAKLPDSQFSAEQMLEMLASLPNELPLETKRATVKAMLGTLGKNVGATPETIVADTSRKLAALGAYCDFLNKKTTEFTTKTEAEIAELESQIEAKKTALQSAKSEHTRILSACDAESDRIDDILEFFSLDVAPSKYAPGEGAPKAA